MLNYPDAAAEIMEHLCNDSAHGYSQPNRAGVGTGGSVAETITLSDGSKVGIAAGDRDCSSAVIECFAALGVNCGGAWYTGDMRSKMVGTGNFQVLSASTWSSAKRGDILLNDGKHVVLALGGGKIGEFASSEHGTISGTRGDQTGRESRIRDAYNFPWNCVLRYCGAARSGSTGGSGTTSTSTDYLVKVSGNIYRVNIDELNVRAASSTSSQIVATYAQGETVTISGTKSANGWLWGYYTGGSGATRYVAIKPDGSGKSSGGTTSTQLPAGTYKVVQGPLNVRKGAGLGYATTGTLPQGYRVNLDGNFTVKDNWVWGRYVANSGYYRFIAVRSADGKTVYAQKV